MPVTMQAIDEQLIPRPRGGILYDAVRLRKPDATLFDRQTWATRGALEDMTGGRGSVSLLRQDDGAEWVLRHYRRGGLIAAITADRYVYIGANRTRAFREWRLLAELRRRKLPVPAPIAATYVRSALTYRADLITERLRARTFADVLMEGAVGGDVWHAVGATIAKFHAEGVHHADLNVHNILLGPNHAVYLLDFDRGRIRARGAWESSVLARLQRSLEKLRTGHRYVRFADEDWRTLMMGYAAKG
jgi:3-deoxy-D-manno-octulosonic acid kinase